MCWQFKGQSPMTSQPKPLHQALQPNSLDKELEVVKFSDIKGKVESAIAALGHADLASSSCDMQTKSTLKKFSVLAKCPPHLPIDSFEQTMETSVLLYGAAVSVPRASETKGGLP